MTAVADISSMTRMQRYIKGGTWFERKSYEGFFRDADTDNDGFLSCKDLTDFLRKHDYTGPDSQIQVQPSNSEDL